MKYFSMLTTVILLLCSTISHAEPYVGADFQWRALTLRGLNAHVFSKRSPGLNAYAGFTIYGNYMLEIGFHSAKSAKNGASLKMKGIHCSILSFYTLNKEDTFRAIAGVGVAQLRHHARHPAYRLDLSRSVPRFITGFEYSFIPSIVARAAFVWESSKSMTKKTDMKFNNAYVLNFGMKYVF